MSRYCKATNTILNKYLGICNLENKNVFKLCVPTKILYWTSITMQISLNILEFLFSADLELCYLFNHNHFRNAHQAYKITSLPLEIYLMIINVWLITEIFLFWWSLIILFSKLNERYEGIISWQKRSSIGSFCNASILYI